MKTNRNLIISLVILIVLAAAGGIWWWRASGEPVDVVSQIEQDLKNYQKKINDCLDAYSDEARKKCEEELVAIERKLVEYEATLLEIQQQTIIGSTSTPSEVATTTAI